MNFIRWVLGNWVLVGEGLIMLLGLYTLLALAYYIVA